MNGVFIGLDERDVFDEQGHHALALDRRGARIVPYAVKILCKREDSRTRLLAEQPPVGGALALVFALQRVQLPQPVVPVGFQRIRDQAIVRIDLEIATTCELGLVTRPLQLRAPQALGLLDPMGDLLLHRQRHLDRRRRDDRCNRASRCVN